MPIGGSGTQSGIDPRTGRPYDTTGTPIAPGPSIGPTNQFGNPSTFTAAANTQASDYDKIMAGYDDLIKSSTNNPITAGTAIASNVAAPTSITPQTAKYQQSSDVTSSLAGLSNLSSTGGYSDQDKADIRARDISPIRSIYSSARQNAERAKALGGGYSPNYNATQAQMARDEAGQIGGTVTAANAGIAQNVAANRISATGAYAGASGSANSQQAEADQKNADIINQANEFNTTTGTGVAENNANRSTGTSQFNVGAALDAAKTNRGIISGALAGKTSLYGTTPALTNTFGNQVMQAGQLGQNQQVINNNRFGQITNLARGG